MRNCRFRIPLPVRKLLLRLLLLTVAIYLFKELRLMLRTNLFQQFTLLAIACCLFAGCSSSTPDSESFAPPAAATTGQEPVAEPAKSAESTVTEELETSVQDGPQTATLGAGCFWCVEAVFEQIEGVTAVRSGYSGGLVENPTYEAVCTGTTGHAEVIQLDYDPAVTTFEEVLQVFFTSHDPTTLNRQGADVGTQYRSAIFYHTQEQKQIAEKVIAELNESKAFPGPIVTEVTEFEKFYEAEDYHQDYFELNGRAPYCRMVIVPKVEKVKKVFAEKLKPAAKTE
jgi:peptide-methionine (S)-S-oxide reductase